MASHVTGVAGEAGACLTMTIEDPIEGLAWQATTVRSRGWHPKRAGAAM